MWELKTEFSQIFTCLEFLHNWYENMWFYTTFDHEVLTLRKSCMDGLTGMWGLCANTHLLAHTHYVCIAHHWKWQCQSCGLAGWWHQHLRNPTWICLPNKEQKKKKTVVVRYFKRKHPKIICLVNCIWQEQKLANMNWSNIVQRNVYVAHIYGKAMKLYDETWKNYFSLFH